MKTKKDIIREFIPIEWANVFTDEEIKKASKRWSREGLLNMMFLNRKYWDMSIRKFLITIIIKHSEKEFTLIPTMEKVINDFRKAMIKE